MAELEQNVAPQVVEAEHAPNTNGTSANADVEMADPIPSQEPAANPTLQPTVQSATPTPAPQPAAPSAPSLPAPSSSRNSPHPAPQAPTQPIPHGSPTRVYLNQNVTPHLLEAMKHLATNEPEKPLKWLSEFLAMKSAEIEG